MLTSKEVLDQTGISRATLNNYISAGLVMKPEVLPPGPDDGDAPRIGYFPVEVVARIGEIQRLKNLGWSLARIAERFAGGGTDEAASPPVPAASSAMPASSLPGTSPLAHAFPATPPVIPGTPSPADDHAPIRIPGVTPVAVLVASLDQPHRTWAALPPREYFELINQIWGAADPIVRRHHGAQSRHASDGMVCYFFPRPVGSFRWSALLAAMDLREAMRAVSLEWQLRKGWPLELSLNMGIDEGREWLGRLRAAPQPELAGLAGTLRRASRIAESAAPGSVWATKNLVLRLAAEEQAQLRYGIRQQHPDGEESIAASFFRLADSPAHTPASAPDALALVPITEIIDIAPQGAGR